MHQVIAVQAIQKAALFLHSVHKTIVRSISTCPFSFIEDHAAILMDSSGNGNCYSIFSTYFTFIRTLVVNKLRTFAVTRFSWLADLKSFEFNKINGLNPMFKSSPPGQECLLRKIRRAGKWLTPQYKVTNTLGTAAQGLKHSSPSGGAECKAFPMTHPGGCYSPILALSTFLMLLLVHRHSWAQLPRG